jgi:hypothetical protein
MVPIARILVVGVDVIMEAFNHTAPCAVKRARSASLSHPALKSDSGAILANRFA